jgi:hypothetical protein
VSRLSRQCGILNISQPYRSPRPVTGTALRFLIFLPYTMPTIYAIYYDLIKPRVPCLKPAPVIIHISSFHTALITGQAGEA